MPICITAYLHYTTGEPLMGTLEGGEGKAGFGMVGLKGIGSPLRTDKQDQPSYSSSATGQPYNWLSHRIP